MPMHEEHLREEGCPFSSSISYYSTKAIYQLQLLYA
jgi:hypothetical protein